MISLLMLLLTVRFVPKRGAGVPRYLIVRDVDLPCDNFIDLDSVAITTGSSPVEFDFVEQSDPRDDARRRCERQQCIARARTMDL